MSAPELHADDLLDKEARGELSPDEQTRLDEHLAACSVCRFERDAREDFRAEFEAEAQRERRASPRAGEPRNVFGERERQSQGPRRARSGMALLLVAALLTAGVATAEWARFRGSASRAPTVPGAASSNGSNALHRHSVPSAENAAAAPSALIPAQAPPEVSAEPAAVSETYAAKAQRSRAVAAEPSAAALGKGSFPVLDEPAASAGSSAPPTAEALFGQANQLRERGAYDDAVRAYGALIDAYPQEPEALSAHAMLGRLLLDRGEPAAALGHFEAYLRSGANTLGEEAQLGRALALRKLGRTVDEIQAWQQLLAAYPGSVHAARARERLSELGTR